MPPPTDAHPPEFVRLCERTVALLRAIPGAPFHERGERITEAKEALAALAAAAEALDLRDPGYPDEQGYLTDASSALLAIDLDRGGPNVPRFVERAVADVERITGAPPR